MKAFRLHLIPEQGASAPDQSGLTTIAGAISTVPGVSRVYLDDATDGLLIVVPSPPPTAGQLARAIDPAVRAIWAQPLTMTLY